MKENNTMKLPKNPGGMESEALKFLSNEEITTIHRASMQVLSKTGFKLAHSGLLETFQKKGVRVDMDNQMVFLDEATVMEAVRCNPSQVCIHGREAPENDVILGGKRVYLGSGGTAVNILDLHRVRRKTTAQDVAATAKLVDALDNIHFFVIPCHPSDSLSRDVDVNRFFNAMDNTTKPIMGGCLSLDGVERVIEMAALVAGGHGKLREKPFIGLISSMVSPLTMDTQHAKMTIKVAKARIPMAFSIAPIAGATSPISLAGTLTQLNAEALAAITVAQTISPGTPSLYSAVPTIMDMRTSSFLFGSVESGIMNAAAAQMAQYYNLPLYSTGGISDSKQPDQQAGYEKAFTALMPALAGANFIHEAAGQLDSGMTIAYAQYVIDNDINGCVMRSVRGIETDEEALAAEVINAIGPGGNFLGNMHTMKRARTEFYYPQAATRTAYDGWESNGRPDTWTQAEKVAATLLREHTPKSLPEKIVIQILKQEPGIICDYSKKNTKESA